MHQIIRSPVQLGTIIRRERLHRNWSQSDLAALCGLRQEMLSRIETGHEGTKLSTIYAIFAALDLELVVGQRNTGHADDIEDIF